jgi:competence protein ComEC
VSRARPLVAPAVGFLVGAAAGLWPVPAPAWLVLLLPLVLAPRLVAAAFLAAGWMAASAARAGGEPGARPPQAAVQLAGRVVGAPEVVGDQVRFRLAREGERLEVTAGPLEWPLALGDTVRLEAALRPPPRALNPGGRDRAGQLAAAGVPWLARASSPVVRLAPPSPAAALERLRGRFAGACERFLPPREAALLRAIGAGDRSALDDPARRSFARSGLAHILAVSGMHLVVVVFGLWRLLRALLVRWDWLAARADARSVAAAACLPWPFAYALATGANPPVLRAALAAALALGGALLRREGDALNGLALAALALLAGEPAAALDPSFQLSFAAVAGLALWAGPLRRRLPVPPAQARSWRARLLEPLLQGAAATLAASLATAPVLAFHFRQLPLLGLPANLAAIPLGSGLTVLATAGALCAPLHELCAAPFLLAAWPLAAALRAVSDLAAAPRWGALGVGSPGLWGALGCAALSLAAGRLRRAARLAAVAGAAACLLLPAPLRAAAARARGGLEVLFVAVGQGDAALLRLPDGGAVLVDGGGSPGGGPDPGEQVLLPLLRDLGVRRLAAVFVSHPHPDHVLGLRAVLDALPVERAFGNGDPGEGEAAAVLARLAPEPLRPGEAWERAGVRFEALGGDRAGLQGNDASLVLRVGYGATRFLFTGDIEAEGEARALAAGGLAAEVVKVPHHGSSTSSSAALAAAVAPAHAVVSVGQGNRFGFPRAETVARWEAVGARVARTDQGAVRFLSDGLRVRRLPTSPMLDPLATLRERR